MNNLNSSIIEGVIAEIHDYSETEKKCTFTLASSRFIKVGGKIVKKTNVFSVLAMGKLAEDCFTKKKGRGIRVVGKLDTTENNAMFIEAEHIEFRPEK
jgi:single-stranded DNA-binding protein